MTAAMTLGVVPKALGALTDLGGQAGYLDLGAPDWEPQGLWDRTDNPPARYSSFSLG